jgi:hypothetical protein
VALMTQLAEVAPDYECSKSVRVRAIRPPSLRT